MSDDPKPPDTTFIPDKNSPGTLEDVLKESGFASNEAPSPQPRSDAQKLLDRMNGVPPEARQAIHTGELWGGPRFIHNATREPVWVETKEQYFALLAREGLRMEDQQESNPAPNVERRAPEIPVFATPHPEVRPLTKYEAEVFGAITAVFRRYGLKESLWCEHCFARNQPHGTRLLVDQHRVAFQCRGGSTEWRIPIGEQNVVLTALATSAVTKNDGTFGTITTSEAGPQALPVKLLQPQESLIIREYIRIARLRGLEPRWHHEGCWGGNAWNEDDAMAISISDTQIIAFCKCFQLFDRTSRSGASEVVN